MTELARVAVNGHNILAGLADFSFGAAADVPFVEKLADDTEVIHLVASVAKIIEATTLSNKGFKNVFINGEVERINQRGFDGISFVDGEYCFDRWRATATAMVQIVEDGGYKPSTVYTLSGDNVVAEQVTSPASGNWITPEVPRNARNVQLEEGEFVTLFDKRPISLEMSLCRRYFQKETGRVLMSRYSSDILKKGATIFLKERMRLAPTVSNVTTNDGTFDVLYITEDGFLVFTIDATDIQASTVDTFTADAEI